MLALASSFSWRGCLDSRPTFTCSSPCISFLSLLFLRPLLVIHSTLTVGSLGSALEKPLPVALSSPWLSPSAALIANHSLHKTDGLFHMAVIWSRTFLGSHCLWNRPSRTVADGWIALYTLHGACVYEALTQLLMTTHINLSFPKRSLEILNVQPVPLSSRRVCLKGGENFREAIKFKKHSEWHDFFWDISPNWSACLKVESAFVFSTAPNLNAAGVSEPCDVPCDS